MSLLVVGSVAYDSIETPKARVDEALGGSATFFSAAASYFAPVDLVAVVGEDFHHEQVEFLRQRQVDLQGLTTERGKTFRWKGRYLDNMNDRETLYTHLNVFESFNPVLPEKYRDCDYVFLANISPDLQYHVIDQVHRPKFVAMDTMNFWISGTPEALRRTLGRVNALMINDSEVKQLSGEDNIFTGIRIIQSWGPQILIVKKGEHGALMANGEDYFYCPAYPVATLFDPTGAGDSFAGGFMGYLAMSDSLSRENLRRAVVFGAAMASFCVEDFGVGRMTALSKTDIDARVTALRQMTEFAPDTQWLHSR